MKISRILLGAAVVVAMTACGGNEKKDAECATEEQGTEEVVAVETPTDNGAEVATEGTETTTETAETPAEGTEAPAENADAK